MTQAWLVNAYRNCNATKVNIHGPADKSDIVCPTPDALGAFEEAVTLGYINWHALPFNAEPEMFSVTMFDTALNMTFAEGTQNQAGNHAASSHNPV
jgi:hypothetical protein